MQFSAIYAATQKLDKLLFSLDLNGAPGRSNLEPFECDQILTELEEWTSILRSEPEVIHRLAAFAEAAEGEASVEEPDVLSLPEVSP